MITIDSILTELEEAAREGQVFAPTFYLERAQMLNALIGNESDRLFELQQQVAKLEVLEIENGKTATQATKIANASDIKKEERKQSARVKRVEEHIRIAKKFATLKSEELRGGSINV